MAGVHPINAGDGQWTQAWPPGQRQDNSGLGWQGEVYGPGLGVWGEEPGQPLPVPGEASVKKDAAEMAGGHPKASTWPSEPPGDPARAKDSSTE